MKFEFNPSPAHMCHVDINSCFATIEQQANPSLRGKPIAVAAYTSPNGCILAPSVEAKEYGVKTGMRVKDGLLLCPFMKILPADPWKYRSVHLKLKGVLENYTDQLVPKSIDEFVLDLDKYLVANGMDHAAHSKCRRAGEEIRERIKVDVGEAIRVSIGFGPSRFIAKTAAGYKKPDGLTIIDKNNFEQIYENLELTDLTGISVRNELRLKSVGIRTVKQFYEASVLDLKAAFKSVLAMYWYSRLRGHEIDNVEYARRSYGNSYSLPKPHEKVSDLKPIMSKLVTKMSSRLRAGGYGASGVHFYISFRDGTSWHKGRKLPRKLFETREIYKYLYDLFIQSPRKPVRKMGVSVFDIEPFETLQLEMFEDAVKKKALVWAVDDLNERWGDYVVYFGNMLETEKYVPDRISFGNVKELEEFS